MNGLNKFSGRVERCVGNEWGTVCADGFNDAAAKQACKMAGLGSQGEAVQTLTVYRVLIYYNIIPSLPGAFVGFKGVFGRGIGEVYSSLDSNTTAPSTCSSDANVFCPEPSPSVCANGQVRLAGSLEENEGRLEVCVGNQWGTICDDSWNDFGATIACSQLTDGHGRLNTY